MIGILHKIILKMYNYTKDILNKICKYFIQYIITILNLRSLLNEL